MGQCFQEILFGQVIRRSRCLQLLRVMANQSHISASRSSPCVKHSRLKYVFIALILILGSLLAYAIHSQRLTKLLNVRHQKADSSQSSTDVQIHSNPASTYTNVSIVKTEEPGVRKTPARYTKPAEPPSSAVDISKATQMMERLILYRDLYQQDAWPEISREGNVMPSQLSYTAHYIWCGKNREFRFEHYLGILSVIRLVKPLTLVFHYSDLPVPDRLWYHIWFWELKQSLASLELSRLSGDHKNCNAKQLSAMALDLLAQDGGFYIAPNVILTRFPKDITQQDFWFSTVEKVPSVMFSLRGFDGKKKQEYTKRMEQASGRECTVVDTYNRLGPVSSPPCLVLTQQFYPQDVVTDTTAFGELARWLHYGARRILEAKQSQTSSIPRIAHATWLRDTRGQTPRFYFFHFLSVLSALHVAGLRHVYVYGDAPPTGEWWDRLKKENVTFVPIKSISHVYQQGVRLPPHRSDVIRPHLLRAYGGVYMDVDVFWVSRLPDSLLRYPTVACPDWPARGQWPAAFNIGVLMSQSDSPWLRHFLSSMRRYIDEIWYYNAIMMPYRVYEMYPESLHIDYRLQVICFRGNCHPAWHDDYIRDINDPRPPRDFNWREGRAFHFTVPKPHKTLTSPDEIRKMQDVYAEMGHQILTKAGWGSLIGEK